MAITKQKKSDILQDLEDKLSRYKSAVFVDYTGINVQNMEKIREDLRNEDVDLKIAKKTLVNRALKNKDIEADARALEGQVAVAFGYKDEVAPARILHKFTKDVSELKILAGLLGKDFMSKEEVENLAQLPSYEELLGKMVGSMQAPISGFANVLAGNMRGLVQVLNAISQK